MYTVIGLHSIGNEEFMIELVEGDDHLCNQKNKFYYGIVKEKMRHLNCLGKHHASSS